MRTIEDLRQDNLEEKHMKKVRSAKRLCYYPGCIKQGINSHILQENGILNHIAENGHFLEYAKLTPFRPAGFYLTGINNSEMFTFRGFCNSHDSSVFYEIENEQSDFSEVRHRKLFAYRGLVNDLFKAEVVTDYFNRVFHDNKISNLRKENFKIKRARTLYAKKDLQHYKMLMDTNNSKFKFYRFETPKIEIATSAIYGAAFYYTLDYNEISKFKPLSSAYTPVSKPIFINLIPRNSSLIIILGHVDTVESIESFPVSNIGDLDPTEVLCLVSRMLTKIETWGMSKALYNTLQSQGKMGQYFELRHKWLSTSFNNPSPFEIPLNFNLFQNIIEA